MSTDRVLAEADDLVAAGRFADAIAAVSAANRVMRDRRLERRLVGLRSEAFQATGWSTQVPSWPTHVEDRFPGEGIPEIAGGELDADVLRSAIEHHGSLLVRELVPREHVARLVGDIDLALAAYDATTAGALEPELDGWYERFERDTASNRPQKRKRGSVMTVESPPTLFDLIDVLEACGAAEVVRRYFGEPPLLLARKGTLRKIAHGGNNGGWHQDGAFMGLGVRSLNLWLALSHCGDDAPGLDVVGRRLTSIVSTGGGAFAAWATDPDAAEEAAAGSVVRPIFEPGDALLFDHLNLHRTAIDPGMREDRYAIETWFLSPSTYGEMSATVDDGYSPRDQVPIAL